MRRLFIGVLLTATIAPLSVARADYDSWGCGGIVADAGASLEYPGAKTLCTTIIPAGRQQLSLRWAPGAAGYVRAEVVESSGSRLAYAACMVLLGVTQYCNTEGPFTETSYFLVGAAPIGIAGFTGSLTLPADARVTLSVAPNGIGGSTPWVTWMFGQFSVGAY